MLSRADAAAEVMEHLISHAEHGYSQYARLGDGTTERITLSDGEVVTIHGGDYDCSESVRACYAAVGVLPFDSYMWTGNEIELLTTYGFVMVPLTERKRGDVLLRSGHTEMLLSRDVQAGFRIAETGGIHGAKGDQTGYESTKSAYTPWRWSACYRYAGKELEEPKKQAESEDVMGAIMRIEGTKGHYYFDGQKMHAIATPQELDALDKAYALATGKKELPRAIWPKKDVDALIAVMKR